MAREITCKNPADSRDIQAEEYTRERHLLRALDRLDRRARRDLGEALQLDELLLRQAVEAGQGADEALLPEDADRLLADTVDVGDGRPVDQRLETAGRTRAVRAAVHRLALRLDDLRAAERAMRRHSEFLRPAPMRSRGPDDLGNDVARALDDDVVALADPFAVDVLLVVQRRARDGDAPDLDGLHDRPGIQRTGPPHPDADLEQTSDRRQRRPFVRARPTRTRMQHAEPALLVERVDLDHDAVDLVVELQPPLLPLDTGRGHVVDRLEPLGVRVGAQAVLAQPLEHRKLRLELDAIAATGSVDPDRERPVGSDRRVLLAEASRRRVARIRRELLARARQALVQLPEAAERQVHLAPHLDQSRRIAIQP